MWKKILILNVFMKACNVFWCDAIVTFEADSDLNISCFQKRNSHTKFHLIVLQVKLKLTYKQDIYFSRSASFSDINYCNCLPWSWIRNDHTLYGGREGVSFYCKFCGKVLLAFIEPCNFSNLLSSFTTIKWLSLTNERKKLKLTV